MRITRWDEERQTGPGTGPNFNNKVHLWNFRFGKPGVTTPAASASDLTACTSPVVQGLGTAGNFVLNSGSSDPADKQKLKQAFMLNLNTASSGGPKPSTLCWATVDKLLSQGIKTTVCAAYTGNMATNHMEVKFVPCPNGVFDENKTLGN